MKKISWKKLAAVTGTCAMVVGSMPANIVLASDGDVKEKQYGIISSMKQRHWRKWLNNIMNLRAMYM